MKQTIVIKIGTGVLTNERGVLDELMIKKIVDEVVILKKQGLPVVLVSSGAMGAGRTLVSPGKKLGSVAERQILASVGQVKLMSTYATHIEKHGFNCAQILATKEDFRDRHHYLNMQNCFTALLNDNLIPIVNENDVVAVDELMFTDNDELAGMVAGMLNAERLIILSTVDGVLTHEGIVIATVDKNTKLDEHVDTGKSAFGRGGMLAKAAVARRLAKLGITTHIINGKQPHNIGKILKGETVGTTFQAERRLSPHKKWLANARGSERGSVTINECAEDIFRDAAKATSLLPVGIIAVQGDFTKGDVVKIINKKNAELGYGRAEYGASDLEKLLGKKNQKPFVHYDYLFLNL
jgi:glutamate 5-kinase